MDLDKLDDIVGEPTPAHLKIVLPATDWGILTWLLETVTNDTNTTTDNREYYLRMLNYFDSNYTHDYKRGLWPKALFTVRYIKPARGTPRELGMFNTLRDAMAYTTRHNAQPGSTPAGVFFNRQAVREEGL